jgi:hypothetical protein
VPPHPDRVRKHDEGKPPKLPKRPPDRPPATDTPGPKPTKKAGSHIFVGVRGVSNILVGDTTESGADPPPKSLVA